MKILFLDLETTGLDPKKNGIHQISLTLEVDGQIVKEVNVNVRPFPQDEINADALKVSGLVPEQIVGEGYYSPQSVYKSLIALLDAYCNKFDKKDKVFLCGYNSQNFDSPFLRAFFEKNGDKYFGSYFWTVNFDVMIMAGFRLAEQRPDMPDFKLATVAKWMGIEVDETKLHDATYDLILTRGIFERLRGG